jgi:ribosomal protein S14
MSERDRAKRREQIAGEILFSHEAQNILGFCRERLRQVCNEGHITPIRKGVYLKDDVMAYKRRRDEEKSGIEAKGKE